jgi:hypothetical protein
MCVVLQSMDLVVAAAMAPMYVGAVREALRDAEAAQRPKEGNASPFIPGGRSQLARHTFTHCGMYRSAVQDPSCPSLWGLGACGLHCSPTERGSVDSSWVLLSSIDSACVPVHSCANH